MVFKKHNWMEYGRRGNLIEIFVRDENNRKLDHFRTNNPKETKQIANILKEKYGFDFSPEVNEKDSINAKESLKKEKGWLDKDTEW